MPPRLYALGVACLLALAMTACIKTPYQQAGFRGGYQDFETNPGTHFVSFTGNGFTSRDEVIAGWHHRAAEICGGSSRYTIVSQNAETRAQTTTMGSSRVDATATTYGNTTYVRGTVSEASEITVYKSRAEGYVRCSSLAPPEENPTAITTDCDGGNVEECMVIAKQYHEAGNEVQALVYVAKGCKAGYAAACIHAAKALESGEHIDADPVKAATFWKKACKLGDDSGCDGFARLRAEGIEPLDSDVAGCDRGDVDGCLRAARERFDAGDLAGSLALTARACESGALDACRHAATAYEAGDGVPRDLARAADLTRAACKLGADDGCEAFARLQNRAATVDETGTTTSPASEDPAGEGELESEGTKRRGP